MDVSSLASNILQSALFFYILNLVVAGRRGESTKIKLVKLYFTSMMEKRFPIKRKTFSLKSLNRRAL